jgi:tetratricopeptide (TPR) repeat protein
MSRDVFTWLHLTDLHWGLSGQDCLWPTLRQPFFDDLARVLAQTGPVHAVLFTGDLVQSGKSEQFDALAKEFLARLWTKLAELGSNEAVLLVVPGNHDLNRELRASAALTVLRNPKWFETIADDFWRDPNCDYRGVVRDAFGAYSQWWEGETRRPPITAGILPGDFACTLTAGSHRVGIVGLNTTFLQLAAGDYQESLAWNASQVHAVCDRAVDDWCEAHSVRLLLTHQGPTWLSHAAQLHGESEVAPAGRFSLHLFGHMHEPQTTWIRRGASAESVRLCQGASVFGLERWGEPPKEARIHGYSLGQVSFEANGPYLRLWPRLATNKTGPWRYVPDHVHANLRQDDGTEPESLGRARAVSRSVSSAAGAFVAFTPLPPRPQPHSTLQSRQPFFGRTDELAMVARTLQPDHVGWGIVLDGPGGIGKTALALEAAHRVPGEHFPLKLFVSAKRRRLHPDGEHELTDHQAVDYQALLLELGRALARPEVERVKAEDRPALVRHALAEHRPLLVLDNLETFAQPDRRRLYDFLELLPDGCKAIVTSRRRDDTAARTLRLDKLSRGAADQLLATLGAHAPAVARLSEDDLARLYVETGGNPLLLTWTAGQLGRARGRCNTVDQTIERLREAHSLQAKDEHNDPLEFVYGDLVDTFSAEELEVLSALTWFEGPAKLAWVLPLTTLSQVGAETALDDLRDRALLVEDEAAATWWLPPLAARFIQRRRPDVVEAAGMRLEKDAYAAVMRHGGSDKAPFSELEAAWPTVEAALPRFLAGDNRQLHAVCNALDEFLQDSGRWELVLSFAGEAERNAAASGDAWNAGWRNYDQAFVHMSQGDADALSACTARCEAHWAKFITPRAQAITLTMRAWEHRLRGDHHSAVAAARHALALFRGTGPQGRDVAVSLQSLATQLLAAGDIGAAEETIREALARFEAGGHKGPLATAVGNLAEIHLARGDWLAAEAQIRKALALSQANHRIDIIGRDHHVLARALLAQGRAADALPHARQAAEIYDRLRAWGIRDAPATLAACEAALRGSGSAR